MKLDREVQRKILTAGEHRYPNYFKSWDLVWTHTPFGNDEFVANAAYLKELGLLELRLDRDIDGEITITSDAVITAKGMDFLADDGGLTAIMGTVVVKLHADTIRDMLLAKAEASGLPAPEKSALRKQIEALPGAALQTLTTRAAQEGLAHVPDLLHWIRSVCGL